ncbi:hypothetical protein Vretimale_15397 [Volvox reticuliferus]|uniref:Uncharacterized protein n=1 Tax=Volvox reticuliferus TaxID=1737510 RepID=A0A8J4CTS1_9CHLO|nr:hypothetical protein Vretifemale_16408 [Volvox reticuliferus]GIM11957.1 hypothetical protein Vretimale_15397 [Volvox reticuliferus]
MFLLQSQLEPVVLRRLEQLQGVHNGPALGMCNCLRNALQANNSSAGVEWSSTDGNDEIPQENFQVDLSDASMSLQLDAWGTWLAPDGLAAKAHYYAATHALVQEILGSILVGSSEPSISRTALDAAWGEDAGSSTDAFLPADRLKSSLAALATTSSNDGTPQTAAACLSILLTRLQGQPQRWQGLVEQYAAGADPQLPVTEAEAAGGGGAVIGAVAGGRGATDDDVADDDINDDIDALLKDDAGDLKDSTPAANTALGMKVIASADATEPAVANADNTAAVSMAAEDEDDTFSLGLSRVPSHTSVDPNGQEETSTTSVPGSPAAISVAAAAAAARRAARAISVKSVEDPELRRTLSETSSANLDDLPSEDLETLIERANSHANSSTRLARQPAASSGGAPGDINLGHLAEMDLRAWAAKKDKPPPMGVSRGRPVPGSVLAPLLGRADAVKPVMDQHLKAARAPRTPGAAAGGPGGGAGGGNGTSHFGAFGGSPVRQSMERERGGGGVLGNGISRHGSNDSPTALHPRSRSLGTNLSRKLSISEPGPVGPQAEWKHLPALGQATRLHPHEMRQQSYGIPRTGEQSRGRGECAGVATQGGALMEDKLPSLPALAGARGQPPKAMELFRRPSQVQRSDAHHADTAQSPAPNSHLPGLGPPTRLAAARALCVQATKKKSFRGDDNF